MFKAAAGRLIVSLLAVHVVRAQSTQGLIFGTVVDSLERHSLAATLTATHIATNLRVRAVTGASGNYALPLLPPGLYRIRVESTGYQAQELYDLDLPVAAFLNLEFHLRPLEDVWEQGQKHSVFLPGNSVLVFFGPDLDTSRTGSFQANGGRSGPLETGVSQVISPAEIGSLPLQARDVYASLLTQPGVTSDTTTGRGLGLSINGQRPSSSNFMLDGVENNNYLTSGPLFPIPPEQMQEYRVSINNFAAEYGRTAGYLANAVTRSGSNRWHAQTYVYAGNSIFNSREFQQNAYGLPRAPGQQWQPGFTTGGPIRRSRLFVSASYERFHFRSSSSARFVRLPTLAALNQPSLGGDLLRLYHPPALAGDGLFADTVIAPLSMQDRHLGTGRLDYTPGDGKFRFMLRAALARFTRPDLFWTPYPDFNSTLRQRSLGLAAAVAGSFGPAVTTELRVSRSGDTLRFDRPHPEIPTMLSLDGTQLPGSPAYDFKNAGTNWELNGSVTIASGRNLWKAGGGALLHSAGGYLDYGRSGRFLFDDITAFEQDRPLYFQIAVARSASEYALPDYAREYTHDQYFGFVQNSVRLSSRVVLNLGLRYEHFGAPQNTGPAKDLLVQLGASSNPAQRIVDARLVAGPGQQPIYPADNGNWAGRAGIAWDIGGHSATTLRAAFGTFYDRPFDNLWQNVRNNDLLLGTGVASTTVLGPFTNSSPPLQSLSPSLLDPNYFPLTAFAPDMKTSRVYSYSAVFEHRLATRWTISLQGLGAIGGHLLTTDLVNRQFTVMPAAGNIRGRLNPALPDILYRGSQGGSLYNALALTARYRSSRVQAQVAYTWSHSIDNQSDALAGDLFDLGFTRSSGGISDTGMISAFSRQFLFNSDRANSDFDQRQNLVSYAVWDLTSSRRTRWLSVLTRDWRVSEMAAFRTGFPYSVTARNSSVPLTGFPIVNNRANLVLPQSAFSDLPAQGGKLLLSADAFSNPSDGTLGNTGRNAFRGPGLFSLDVAIARSFRFRPLGESGAIALRADAFNVLNHANLNNPVSSLLAPDFGVARFGRTESTTGFPALVPFDETARVLQLSFRISF